MPHATAVAWELISLTTFSLAFLSRMLASALAVAHGPEAAQWALAKRWDCNSEAPRMHGEFYSWLACDRYIASFSVLGKRSSTMLLPANAADVPSMIGQVEGSQSSNTALDVSVTSYQPRNTLCLHLRLWLRSRWGANIKIKKSACACGLRQMHARLRTGAEPPRTT